MFFCYFIMLREAAFWGPGVENSQVAYLHQLLGIVPKTASLMMRKRNIAAFSCNHETGFPSEKEPFLTEDFISLIF